MAQNYGTVQISAFEVLNRVVADGIGLAAFGYDSNLVEKGSDQLWNDSATLRAGYRPSRYGSGADLFRKYFRVCQSLPAIRAESDIFSRS